LFPERLNLAKIVDQLPKSNISQVCFVQSILAENTAKSEQLQLPVVLSPYFHSTMLRL